MILAIDPGSTQSGWVYVDGDKILNFGKTDNNLLLDYICARTMPAEHLAIESIASYGMAVGAEVFETCVWSGRFIQRWRDFTSGTIDPIRIYRREVKLHLCDSPRAKDGNVRQAIIDRYGSEKSIAIGTKKNPGPLYGVAGDVWQALAVAITADEVILKGESK